MLATSLRGNTAHLAATVKMLRDLAPPTLVDISPLHVFATYKACLDDSSTLEGELSIRGHIHRVDPEEKKLSIEWQVSCAPPPKKWPAGPQREDPEAGQRESLDYAVGAYAVDVYLTDDAGNALSYDPTRSLGLDKFETLHELRPSGHFPEPFDSYTLHLSALAINPADNLSVDIAQFSVPGSPNGFTISSSSHEADVTNRFMYDAGDGSEIIQVRPRALTITIQYSAFTLALTMCTFVANWALTLGSLHITLSAIKKGQVTWPAFILHNTMLLVILSIRKLSTWPQPFGVFLDTVGLFPQVLILSFCSLALLRTLVQPRVGKKPFSRVGRKM